MQSFGAPRPTTNPYIHMLDEALAGTDGVEHLRFNRRRALFGRYDVLQLHWPETLLLGESTGLKAAARRLYVAALLTRLRFSRIAVIRTVHNVELPSGTTALEHRMLAEFERLADYRIVLNELTEVPAGVDSSVIPHGHYRDWYRNGTDIETVPGALGFVGLVRRYKGVETLIDAFAKTKAEFPDATLRVSGNPSTEELATEIRRLADGDPRVEFDLRFLSEGDFAAAMRRCAGVVLPYRFMHNSGAVLAALSLDRPVLVPRNDVNIALAEEVGPGWIHLYDGELDASDLAQYLRLLDDGVPSVRPNLERREWANTGIQHRDAFDRAIASRARGRAGRR